MEIMTTNTPAPRSHLATQAGIGHTQETYYIRNQAVVVPDGYLVVGRAVGAHGLHGEMKIELYTDFPERFVPGALLYFCVDLQEVVIEKVRDHKNRLLVKFAGIDSRSAAEEYHDCWLYVDEEDAAVLEDGAYWVHDIIGLTAVTVDGVRLGEITDVLPTGANDVYVVRSAPDFNSGRDVLLPAMTDVVVAVDLAAGTMTVRLPDGLIDE
jgi:16S rRNA processing protein RimM